MSRWRAVVLLGAMLLGLLACPSRVSAQTLVSTSFVTVDNGDPQNVFLHFATGPNQNIMLIQMSCSLASVNRNRVFVYELAPNGQINGYETTTTVTCDIHFSDPNHTDDVFTSKLVNPVTVTTPDHTITIEQYVPTPTSGTYWMANLKAGVRGGYYWNAIQSESQAQILVQ